MLCNASVLALVLRHKYIGFGPNLLSSSDPSLDPSWTHFGHDLQTMLAPSNPFSARSTGKVAGYYPQYSLRRVGSGNFEIYTWTSLTDFHESSGTAVSQAVDDRNQSTGRASGRATSFQRTYGVLADAELINGAKSPLTLTPDHAAMQG